MQVDLKIRKYLFILLLFVTNLLIAQVNVSKKQFHLYLLAGQSNMAGRGKVETEDTIAHLRIMMLNKNNEWVLAAEPLHFDKQAVVGVGPGFAFAKAMIEYDSNIIIGLIPCAVGGSSIDFWQAQQYYEPTKSYPYDDAIRRTKIAMQSGTLKGILWQQGESDSNPAGIKLYDKKLKSLIKRLRKDLHAKNVPFLAGTMGAFYIVKNPDAENINKIITQLPSQVKNTAVVSGANLSHKGDETHFDGASARTLGKRYAEVYLATFKPCYK